MVYTKNILLTGAGYTANYGGFLADEMYDKIFNNPKISSLSESAHAIIRNSLDFDYEGIYSDIDTSADVTPQDRLITRGLVVDAYRALDKDLKRDHNRAGGMRGKFGRTLIQRFVGTGEEKGLWFTLNQDLLEESHGKMAYGLPFHDAKRLTEAQVLERKDFVQLPDLADVERLKARILGHEAHVGDYRDLNGFNYIKLHGSYGWLSSDGFDGMIFGKNKPEDIAKEPLLNFYKWLFKEVVCRDGVTLLVIGYSFRDSHINEVILEAMQKKGFRLIIVSSGMEKIRDWLSRDPVTKAIWDNRDAQFNKKLIEIFEDTYDSNLSSAAEDLLNKLS